MGGDFSAEFDGETARLCIQHVYPEDEGEYTCVAYNDLGKAFTSACLIVDGNFVFNSRSFNKAIWKRQVIQIRETFASNQIQLLLYIVNRFYRVQPDSGFTDIFLDSGKRVCYLRSWNTREENHGELRVCKLLSFCFDALQCLKGKKVYWAKDWRGPLDFCRQDLHQDRRHARHRLGLCLLQFHVCVRIDRQNADWQSQTLATFVFIIIWKTHASDNNLTEVKIQNNNYNTNSRSILTYNEDKLNK